jgi:hypothetical protein
MSQASAPTQGPDFYLLHSALLKFGVTPGGADQFLHGLPLRSEEDRGALQEMLLSLVKGPGGNTTSCDCVVLRSALLKFGVTPLGAHQVIEWLPVGNPADRGALLAMLHGLRKAAPNDLVPRQAGERNLIEYLKMDF